MAQRILQRDTQISSPTADAFYLVWSPIHGSATSKQTNTTTKQTNNHTSDHVLYRLARKWLSASCKETLRSDFVASEDAFDLIWSPIHGFYSKQTHKQTNTTTDQTTIFPTKFYMSRAGNGSAHPAKISMAICRWMLLISLSSEGCWHPRARWIFHVEWSMFAWLVD